MFIGLERSSCLSAVIVVAILGGHSNIELPFSVLFLLQTNSANEQNRPVRRTVIWVSDSEWMKRTQRTRNQQHLEYRKYVYIWFIWNYQLINNWGRQGWLGCSWICWLSKNDGLAVHCSLLRRQNNFFWWKLVGGQSSRYRSHIFAPKHAHERLLSDGLQLAATSCISRLWRLPGVDFTTQISSLA